METLAITGGQVLRPDLSVEAADVLVDQDSGTVRKVVQRDGTDGRPGPATDAVLEASDALVIPGLVNAHTHVAMTLFRGAADDKPLDAWLQEDIWPVEAALEGADVRAGAALGVAEMIRSGTTAFADMYFFMPEVASVVEEAGLRARLCRGCLSAGKAEDAAHEDFRAGLEFAREYDGAANGRIQTMFGPHSLTTVEEELFREYVPRAREAGIPVHLHANETESEVDPLVAEHGVRPLVYADDLGVLDGDTYLAHGVHLDEQEIDLLAERGVGIAHCPSANMKLASGMAPIQELLDAGVTVGLGTDGPASNNDLDLLGEMQTAALLGKLAADDASAVAAPTALRMATEAGATLLGIDSGRIEAGANADLAVLDLDVPHLRPAHDLVSHLVYAARGSDVRHTVCDGDVLMRDREIQTLDIDDVMAEASQRTSELFERANR